MVSYDAGMSWSENLRRFNQWVAGRNMSFHEQRELLDKFMSHHKPQISQEWLNRNPFLDIVQEGSAVHRALEFFTNGQDLITLVAVMIGIFGVGLLVFKLRPVLDRLVESEAGAAIFAMGTLLAAYLGIIFLI